VALALAGWVFSGGAALADDLGSAGTVPARKDHKGIKGRHVHAVSGAGTLGYGPPGLYPGFQGFGLGYHLGYGYGGDALGVGAEGGYPFYGGPGYPHPWPHLRRFGRITPFPYYGGPGYPSPEHPNYFGGVGPLVPDRPVVTIELDPRDPVAPTSYGPFTGAVPNAEALFAQFTARAAAGGASMRPGPSPPPPSGGEPIPPTASIPPGAGTVPTSPDAIRDLGIDAEPVVDAAGARGLRISQVAAGTAAERAGLHVGDVILSINGYLTLDRGSLEWIIVNAAPGNILRMNVRSATDGQEHTLTTRFP
jgi:hypothetical protein